MNKRRKLVLALGAGAFATPFASYGQQQGKKIPRVGILWHAKNADEEAPYFGAFIEGLRGLGYTEGRIALEHRFANETPDLFKSMAAELVSLKPDVLVAVGGAAPYLVKATTTIPVVFIYVPDPIGSGLVASIRRPGGNATGLRTRRSTNRVAIERLSSNRYFRFASQCDFQLTVAERPEAEVQHRLPIDA